MTSKEIFRHLRQRLSVSPRKVKQEEEFPSGFECGLVHPQTSARVLLEDNGAVEANTGSASVLLDPNNGQITLKAPVISLDAQTIHFNATPEGYFFNSQRLNPLLFSLPGSPDWAWKSAPIVQTYPGSVAVTPGGFPNIYLSATPEGLATLTALGAVPIPMESIFFPMPLLTMNEEYFILTRNLGKFLGDLGKLAGGLE